MELVRETEWRSFEEVLALALGWPVEDAQERVKQYDAAAGEKPFEFPDRVEKYLAEGGLDSLTPYEGFFDPSAAEDGPAESRASSAPGIAESDLKAYIHAKRMLQQAIANEDITYQDPDGREDALYQYPVLTPAHVSRWLNAMRLHDTGKLLERLVVLEKENKELRREVERRNKIKEDITAPYLKIAIQEYYSIWHGRDESLKRPKIPEVVGILSSKYGLEGAPALAIEKVICPIDRNLANKSKNQT
ncbi:hypothetical protein [Paraburkholderia sp. CI3]|uniref:hypothetical protein n=1 Tax=Paraburkholderia sp. CI3 TaxID=2991060 RepID=UPI003D1AC7D9